MLSYCFWKYVCFQLHGLTSTKRQRSRLPQSVSNATLSFKGQIDLTIGGCIHNGSLLDVSDFSPPSSVFTGWGQLTLFCVCADVFIIDLFLLALKKYHLSQKVLSKHFTSSHSSWWWVNLFAFSFLISYNIYLVFWRAIHWSNNTVNKYEEILTN